MIHFSLHVMLCTYWTPLQTCLLTKFWQPKLRSKKVAGAVQHLLR